MNYATIKYFDIANGQGVRVSLFVSGCRHHCKNCFNEEAWDFNYGEPFTKQTVENILSAAEGDQIAGLSLLGGEPFEPENQAELLALTRQFKQRYPEKNIWCYTGFDFEKDLLAGRVGDAKICNELLQQIDVLVDGKFVQKLHDASLLFRGSSNQRIIDVPKSLAQNKAVWLEGIWQRKMGSGNIDET